MLKISDVKSVLNHIITNNRYLEASGKKKNAVAIESDAGIGKTSIVEQVAKENNLHFTKISLSQIEQTGDICGFPLREFEYVDANNNHSWMNEKHLESLEKGVCLTGQSRTVYAPPSWVPTDTKGTVLLLDDWTRAQGHIIQAAMEIIDRGEFVSWKLPPDCHIFLTSNPDDGNYIVTSIDEAQKTRFIKLKMKFDISDWASWAENQGIDSRCINFLLLNPELIKGEVNARIATDFFNSISSLSDFSTESAYYLISNLGSGSVGEEFTQLFILFINNKLDRLPRPEDVFGAKTSERAIQIIKDASGTPKTSSYKQNIASLISTRLVNCTTRMCNDKTLVARPHVERVTDLILGDVFSSDINFNFVKTLNANPRMSALLNNAQIAKMVMR